MRKPTELERNVKQLFWTVSKSLIKPMLFVTQMIVEYSKYERPRKNIRLHTVNLCLKSLQFRLINPKSASFLYV